MSEEKKLPPQTAYDLKGRVITLMTTTSETLHYLNSVIDGIDYVTKPIVEGQNKIKSLTAEKQALEQSVISLRAAIDQEHKEHTDRMEKEKAEIQELKRQASKDRNDAAGIISEANKAYQLVNKKIEDFEQRRKDFEAKAARVKELIA